MTDSMKFGPEWLRNMSADNTSLLSSGGGSSGGCTSLSNSGSIVSTSSNSNNGGNGGGQHSFGISSNVSTSAITQFSYALAPRNNFPEFRYGREEMLSLFDKNYNMPEILPTYKKIFVEKVQLPLALTPSTDEELLAQVPPVATQRPSWMQRSPVGFSSSTRGTGRGGSVDRGRMRGKSNYHQIYQRPTALIGDNDSRSVALKTDRGWPERNGAGDSLNTSGGNIGGVGLSSDWNGTPASSPRKEFPSHSRNMENWRRNRNDDGSGDASTSTLGNVEGWRGSNSTSGSFAATHRWGRSTSWRDEDISSASLAADVGYGNSGGSGMTMQRSYSTIATVNERGGYVGSTSGGSTTKTPPNPPYSSSDNQASSRTFNALSGLKASSARSTQWNTNSSGVDSSSGAGGDGEDNLPEWAMENPSDGGGTFDASGAFHGSVAEGENEKSGKQIRKRSDSSCESSTRYNTGSCVRESKSSEAYTGRPPSSLENYLSKGSISESSEQSAACTPEENLIDLKKIISPEPLAPPSTNNDPKPVNAESTHMEELDSANLATQSQQGGTTDMANVEAEPKEAVTTSITYYNTTSNSMSKPSNILTGSNSNINRDLSDRMREVADDMIEKLIMDDDSISISDNVRNDIKSEASVQATAATPPSPVRNNLCAPNVFTSVAVMLKQPPHPSISGSSAVSPTLTSLPDGSVHKGIQLCGGGVAVDHATMQHQHLQQQQQQLEAAANLSSAGRLPHGLNAATSTAAPTDLWYYRDPQSKVQGPFTSIEMTEWYRAGYFNENLYVRRLCDTHYRSLGELIKLCNDNMPFTHSHLVPNIDNMHLSNSAAATVRQPQKPQLINDFSLKQQTHQQSEQRDQLKGKFGAAGSDFLVGNVKNRMVPVDVSNMYFQMLRHQEMLIYNELSENECFQQLTPSEKEAVVRQKLQMHSEYIYSLSGLSNSLPSINPTAATNHLYDVMMDGPKKDHLFGSAAANTGSQNASPRSQPNPFLDPDDFLINSQHHQQTIQTVFSGSPFGNVLPPGGGNGGSRKLGRGNDDQTGNELLNNFNMRMFLPPGEAHLPLISNPKPRDYIGVPNADFLNETEMLVARNSLGHNNSLVHSWLPPLTNLAPMVPQQPPNEWPNNMLVGVPMTVVQGNNSATGNVHDLTQEIQQQQQALQLPHKAIPTSMWDLPTLEHASTVQKSQQQVESNATSFESQNSLTMQGPPAKEAQPSVNEGQNLQGKASDTAAAKHADTIIQSQQQNTPPAVLPAASTVTKQRKEETNDRYQNGNTKRMVNKQHPSITKNAKESDESASSKRIEEDRRRDQAEDKRRLKEEKKRQQADGEKRRQQHIEEEKRRQALEEKERRQQIQAQRRKAMLGNNSNANNSSTCLDGSVTSSSKSTKEQRVQSSIAPWSAQTNAAATKGGPCLAEIQKAERRERQIEQRQMELFVKRVRASATAAAEAFDSMLKWNAPAKDVPVKSFAEIQAEEAKRLANEQLEIQRRKEKEQQEAAAVISTSSSAGLGPNSMSAIWSGTKVWGSTSTTGFWEEPIKFSAAVAPNNNSSGTTASAGNSAGSTNNNNKQTPSGQQKLPDPIASSPVSSHSGQNANNQQQNSATRNLRKSQTVSVMQNTATQNGNISKVSIQQHHGNTAKPGPSSKAQQRAGGNNADSGAGAEKKAGIKNQQQNVPSASSCANNNIRDDYENEFVAWCTKSLNNMNTKLDVPTFVTFLRDLESPYEVKDYIRMYLGENKESIDFGKQFLERRSKYKNLQRAQNAHNDDMCKPAPAITPSGNDNFDNKGKQKKVRKNKMTKLDARVLGFSVTAAEGRTNVGDRVYVDAP